MKISLNDILLEGIVGSKIEFLYFEVDNRNEDFFPAVDQIKGQ